MRRDHFLALFISLCTLSVIAFLKVQDPTPPVDDDALEAARRARIMREIQTSTAKPTHHKNALRLVRS